MTLQLANRVRKNRGEQVALELKAAEATDVAFSAPTKIEIRQRAYEIYLIRNGASGDAIADWLQAECELRARKGVARSNRVVELAKLWTERPAAVAAGAES